MMIRFKDFIACALAAVFGIAISIAASPLPSQAQECSPYAAKVDSIQGPVEARKQGQATWLAVKPGDAFCLGDTLHVRTKGRAVVVLPNETVMRLDQDTTITFAAPEKEKLTWYDILKGKAYFISRTPRSFKVNTPFLNAGIEGTEFLVDVSEGMALVSVVEGKVLTSNAAGGLLLTSNQTAAAEAGKPPVLRAVVNPVDAVQWALYYPPLSSKDAPTGWQKQVSELLAVGRVDEAKGELEAVLGREPRNSHALGYQAIIAVTRNEREKAMNLAKRAVDASPDSAAALVAMSYAQQAGHDTHGALNSLLTAVKAEPGNELAWARLSEMRLSFGDRDEALEAAAKATALNPDLARTQSVLGYAWLAQIKTGEARKAFEKAAALDPADPLPRLGNGLALIRDGRLEEGRREIEVAVSLDPLSPVSRSYLGKAYYEEKRDNVAAEQYEMASERDPKDPTPWFYSAIQKQQQNRPVEALHDLQKSVALNDNRAVYRSRLLLDGDHAARSASLARIYGDLGFQQLALAEGWRSLSADPSDYSAHRLLADSYAALPRHEIGRVSEMLQAQLLQPLNLTPLQPHLAESSLYIQNGGGPSSLSFNEFNPLFTGNKATAQISGITGSHDTRGAETTVALLHDRLMFSAGQFHYETDGFRQNNDLSENIYNVFAQYAVTANTSIQVEHRETTKKYGDLPLRFYRDNFSTTSRQEDEMKVSRFGFHHSFGPGSDLIGTVARQSAIYKYNDTIPPNISSIDMKIENHNSSSAEIQYLMRWDYFSLTGGAGRTGFDSKTSTDMALVFPPMTISGVTRSHTSHSNYYLYSQINCLKDLSLTLGVSDDQYNESHLDRYALNPKAGIVWTPLPSTILRAAWFQTVNRTLINNQTLEPTQVAGFNQFYDDWEGTKANNLGLAVDLVFSQNLYMGGSFTWRRLDVPVTVIPDGITQVVHTIDWRERLGRTYLYWTPHRWLSISAEYLYERFDRNPKAAPDIPASEVPRITTHRYPLGITFNHPSGFSTRMLATYVNQTGSFNALYATSGSETTKDDYNFWTFDAALSYRLPKRWGILSLEGKNIFDREFKYQDMNPVSPALQPDRSLFLKFTITL